MIEAGIVILFISMMCVALYLFHKQDLCYYEKGLQTFCPNCDYRNNILFSMNRYNTMYNPIQPNYKPIICDRCKSIYLPYDYVIGEFLKFYFVKYPHLRKEL